MGPAENWVHTVGTRLWSLFWVGDFCSCFVLFEMVPFYVVLEVLELCIPEAVLQVQRNPPASGIKGLGR